MIDGCFDVVYLLFRAKWELWEEIQENTIALWNRIYAKNLRPKRPLMRPGEGGLIRMQPVGVSLVRTWMGGCRNASDTLCMARPITSCTDRDKR